MDTLHPVPQMLLLPLAMALYYYQSQHDVDARDGLALFEGLDAAPLIVEPGAAFPLVYDEAYVVVQKLAPKNICVYVC